MKEFYVELSSHATGYCFEITVEAETSTQAEAIALEEFSKSADPEQGYGTRIQRISEIGPVDYVGLPLDAAEALADLNETRVRVTSVDGQGRMVTMDYDPSRYNFTVVNDIVTEVTRG